MKIIDLYQMSEEDKKKALQEQQQMYNERMQQGDEIRTQANQMFNELISQKGVYNPSQNTFKMPDFISTKKSVSDEILFPTKQEKGLGDKLGYTAANFASGVLQGATGIVQGKLTDTANNLQKGSKMNDVEAGKTVISMLFPNIGKIIKSIDSSKKTIDILKDNTKDGWSKAVEIGLNGVENFKEGSDLYNIADIERGVGNVLPDSAEKVLELNEKISEPSKKVNEYLAEESKKYDDATNFVASGFQSVGNMMPSIASLAITKDPNMSLATLGLSVKGQATQEALDKGEDLETATQIGDAKALVEIATEKLSGGTKIFGKGSVDDLTEDLIKKGAKSKVGRFLLKQLFNVGGEVAEEEISNVANNVIDKGTVDKDKEIINIKEGLETMGSTAFTTTLLNILTGGMINDYKEIDSNMNQYKDYNTNEVLDNNTQNVLKQAVNIINQNSNQNIQQESTQSQQNNQQQQITQQENKTTQNGNTEQIAPIRNYIYEKSENSKIDNLRQDASKYLDNSKKSRNFVNMLEKIIQDKDIDIRFQEGLTDSNGNIANGKYENGTITINPNSDRAGEFIAIHELTHAIGTDSMRNIIENYRKSNEDFDNAVKTLLQNYNTTELTDEAMADVSAQLLGNQEYINNLSKTNPNLFLRIYNEIKYLWHQFKGYSNQNQFIEDLQYKWEQAYRNNNKFNETENYSIAGRKSLENIKNDTNSYNAGINSYNQAQALAKQKIDNEQIRKQTGWFQDKNGDWKYEISDKDMDIKGNIKLKVGKTYKLSSLLKHDTLFTLYPSLQNIDVNIVDKNGARGSYNNKKITLNMKNLKNKKITEATLVHEIQHAIQDIEGFEGGITSKLSKKTYYENLGEIEADDVSKRFADEKYNNANINGIAPESSKSNPKHRYYDEYMKNRGTVDKIKDSVFKYSKKDGSSDAIDQEYLEQTNGEDLQNNNKEVWNRLEDFEKSSFSMDDKGRKLSKHQQEYFRDVSSEVLDENGNLKTFYHGSNNEFTVFEHGRAYKDTSIPSIGYWFTENSEGAKKFADSVWYGDTKSGAKVYEVYLKLKNPKIYESIDNTLELEKIDNRLDELKDTIRKLENKNIAIEINKQELRWANSKEELQDIAKYEGIDYKDAEQYNKAINEYNRLEDEYDNAKYNDSYEQFRADIYKLAGKSPKDANFAGTGMYLENEEKILNKYVTKLKEQGYDGIIIKNTKFDTETLGKDNSQYVVFESNQIKNVNNFNPTSNEDIRYSKNNPNWQDYLDKNIESKGTKTNLKEIRNKDIAPVKELNKDNNITIPTKAYFENKEQIDSLTDEDYEVLNKIYEKEGRTEVLTEKKKASLLEKYANDKYTFKDSLDVLAQKVVNKGHYIDKLAEKANNLELKYVYDKNLNSFAEGQYEIGVAQTDNKGNKIGKSINEIWKPVEDSKLTKEFSEYLLHKHNIDRSGRNKFIFGEEIGPTESTKIALDLERKHPEFKKYAEDIKKFNHNNLNSLKEAGLLTQDTIEYIENMYPNYIAISRNMEDSIYNGSKEETGTRAPLKKATGGNSDIQPIKDTMAQQVIRIKRLINQNELGKQLAKTLKNAQIDEGVDIELSPTLLMDMDTMVDTDNKGNKFYLYFEDGKQKKLRINDNLYESLRPTEISRLEKTFPVKALQKITSVHRSLLTSNNPLFIATNFFKDFQDGMFNSKYSSKFIKNYGKALNEIWTKGKYYESYMANGGMSNTYFDYNEGIKKQPNKFIEKIRNANEIVEQLPRMSEFISTLEDGKSLNEALYNAAEITTNFKRGGDLTKALNRNGANFLNASIQGLDKQFRNFSGQNGAKGYVNLLAKATIMSIVPSILNHMLLDGDDDYEDLPESTKDLYYLFKYDDGKFIRIPKGRVLSVFGAAARRTLEATQGDEDAFEGLGQTIANQVAPNNPLEDNILAPITQVSNNKTWYGSDLVSSRLQKELPENQYDETTDEFSKWLGKQLKMSPKKINYLLDQYSGGVGDVLLPIITPQAKENVVVDKFTTDSVLKNKNVSKFYETLEKQTQIANDSFATDEDSLQLKYLNSVSSEMSDLYKQKREIQMSNISNEEKTKKVREVQSRINELAEKGLSNYSNITKKSNSAKVGDQEYYKDSKGSWKLLDEEEKIKIGNLSLETYSKYKQQVYKETQNKKSSGELSENQNLKDKDKIQILLDSKYSDKEIKSIYESQIKSSNDTQYDIIDKTGIDIKEYLKYKQQNFESDKKDDGTLSGKIVSGSKKDKVVKYLNSMNITGSQRLLLYSLNGYTTTTNQKTQLVKYINTLNLSKNEKTELYNKLSGFTVYKNGEIYYK